MRSVPVPVGETAVGLNKEKVNYSFPQTNFFFTRQTYFITWLANIKSRITFFLLAIIIC